MISTPTVPYNTPSVWYVHFTFYSVSELWASDECTEISLVWNQLIISSPFEVCSVQRFHLRIQALSWRNLWHCSILKIFHVICHTTFKINFNMWVTSGSYVSDIQIVQWVKWVNRCDPLSILHVANTLCFYLVAS